MSGAEFLQSAPYQVITRHVLGEQVELKKNNSVQNSFAADAEGIWLAVVPHDDDMVIGMGMLALAAIAEGIEFHIALVTDGSVGYCNEEQRKNIKDIRKAEMIESCRRLGIPEAHIHFMNFPDGGIPISVGAYRGVDNKMQGVAYALTGLYRQLRPSVVFCNAQSDYHPDHRAVASEVDIACFHAAGAIWPELGKPNPIPRRWEFPVYCPLDGNPDLQLRGSDELFTEKLNGIAAFESQEQIELLVNNLSQAGPVEYYKEQKFNLYHPSLYNELFEV